MRMNPIFPTALLSLFVLFSCGPQGAPDRDVVGKFSGVEGGVEAVIKSSAYRAKDQIQATDEQIAASLRGGKAVNETGYIHFVKSTNTDGNDICNNTGVTICYDEDDLVDCGALPGSALSAFSSDCYTKNKTISNSSLALWQAKSNGFSGEGNWSLVSKASDTSANVREVWRDLSTGLVWSDVVTSSSWCRATGNFENEGNCDGNNTANHNELNICEVASTDLERLGKGNINGSAMAEKVIHWRVPTRNEILQADINGIRFVHRSLRMAVRDEDSALNIWTSTTDGDNDSNAVTYNALTGQLDSVSKTTNRSIICVGWIVKI